MLYIHTCDVRCRDFTHMYIHTRDVRRRDFTASYVTGIFSREDLDDATVYHGCMISHKFSWFHVGSRSVMCIYTSLQNIAN